MSKHIQLISNLPFLSDKRKLSLFLPFFLMRVKVLKLEGDMRKVELLLPLNWMSRNAAGNMFGGYQASLADPVPALVCAKKFPGYRVATKKLDLDFVRVGNSDLILHLEFDALIEAQIREELTVRGRATPTFNMVYTRADGKVCTQIKNTVAIRPKGYVSPKD